PAELVRHRLHAVADAEHGNSELEHRLRRMRLHVVIRREVAAGKDHAFGTELAHESTVDVPRMDLAINLRLAHAARDQLRVLRPEVEDQDPVAHPALFDTVVRCLLHDLYVVDVRFADARGRDLDEFSLLAHFVERRATGVSHARTHATDQLLHHPDR